ncbi:AraC family transcriptional regulator [Alcanivorax sp. HI0033]|uniref:AraC family transcriptional regulator n=1 Tax=unclassified Alcanivorax TaxID=2638842 RepID=UPI0007B9F2FA|nr:MULTISPECIES: AraC family transcriptional regulator [unclassified Alcanivorax]KZX77640.1 AraC family transcriptional regulator [Alcanivorax sp. HI0011]KZX84655.1 AraC family transcriptional regulator [Alcanivorax sp. HI0013]KZY07626.1 AraC family transcriptional regulator [Alcanivorax sp. HI0035]KZX62180.1 AraC family transcriptional regulator [Alcanivorax sp. HI0003]KZX72049.1 AraC family transcriptional regulator [Alcanivorax sp. HI0007]
MYQRRTININRVVKLLQGAARSGASIPDLLDQCDIPRQLLDDPNGSIERDTFIKMMLLIMQQTQDEFLGFGQGRKSKPGTFSMMAHAVINCPTLGAAVERGIRFYDLFELSMYSRITREGDIARLVVRADPRLDFREVIIETSLFVWLRFMSWLVGKAIEPKLVKLDYTDVRNDEEHRFLFDCPIEYSADESSVTFRADFLDLPLVQNELSLSKFLKDSLTQLFNGNIHNVGLPAQIRAIISNEYGNSFPDFTEICGKLNMTPQTLRRRLKEANTSYQEIKDSIRKDASVYYLSKPDLSIDEIALLMGFSEASSFHRAFKKWTGKTPSSFRKEHFGVSQ